MNVVTFSVQEKRTELAAMEAMLPKLATRARAEHLLRIAGEDVGPFAGALDAYAKAENSIRTLQEQIEAYEFAQARRQLMSDQAQIAQLDAQANALHAELDSLFDAAPFQLRRHAVDTGKKASTILQRPDPDREERYRAAEREIQSISAEIKPLRDRVALISLRNPAFAEIVA